VPSTIGLTGGIGSGKSTVAAMLVGCGALLIDTDAIARELTGPGGMALPALEREFGARVIAAGGALDRERMRSLAFADPGVKQRLEAILHPLIGEEARARAAGAAGRCIVFDVPLLAESRHWRSRVERVLVVDCLESTQIERVVQRSAWEPEHVQRVIAQQAPRARRLAIADAVIYNEDLSLPALCVEVQTLWKRWVLGQPA
jgi:dephospho-CoA kinase